MNNSKVIFWSVTVALGGFLFGFDTAVISGAEQYIQEVWELNVFQHGLTVSIALIGTVFGAMFGGIPADKLGRKRTLFWIAVLYLISALGSALATDWYTFMIFRFLGGLGVGASSVTAPMYISEVSPAGSRGKLVALFQFNIVFGILVAYLSNFLIAGVGNLAWRWMLGVEAIPAVTFVVAILNIPESPRWLIVKKGEVETAKRTLAIINPDNVDEQIKAIQSGAKVVKGQVSASLFSSKYRFPVTLAILFAIFNQMSGINAIIYYAPRIFAMTGLGDSASLLSTAGIGLINFLFTLLAMNLIDRFGRKTLMFIGSAGLIVALGLVSFSFYTQNFSGVPIYLFTFIGFFAFSQGAVIWVFLSEIFPNKVRASGQALGSFTHWAMAALIAFTFPWFAEKVGGGHTFALFTVMMILQLLFVWRMMPETKGRTLEELSDELGIKKEQIA
jgi:sugar porter (SP) family MFS transporter